VSLNAFTARIGRIEISATMAINNEATTLRAQGVDLVDFGAGEPHFATPEHIKQAAVDALAKNFTKYTAVAGTKDLREAVAARHKADFNSNYSFEETILTVGGKSALFNTFQVLIDHGDEVIIPVPYWVSFKDQVEYCGGKCQFVLTSATDGFRLTAAMVEKALTPKTKIILVNSPNNPSGAVVAPEDLAAIVKLAASRGIYVLSDECYVYLDYTGRPFSLGSLTEYKDNLLLMGSLSKTYSMTGWRLGFVHFESDLDCAEGGPGSLDQLAAMRGRHALGVHRTAQAHRRRAACHSGREVHHAGGRVLCLPGRERRGCPRRN